MDLMDVVEMIEGILADLETAENDVAGCGGTRLQHFLPGQGSTAGSGAGCAGDGVWGCVSAGDWDVSAWRWQETESERRVSAWDRWHETESEGCVSVWRWQETESEGLQVGGVRSPARQALTCA